MKSIRNVSVAFTLALLLMFSASATLLEPVKASSSTRIEKAQTAAPSVAFTGSVLEARAERLSTPNEVEAQMIRSYRIDQPIVSENKNSFSRVEIVLLA